MATTEEPIVVAATIEVTSEPAAFEVVNKEKNGLKTKVVSELKENKATAPRKPKSLTAHPPYAEMIQEAVMALKGRSGSSPIAIAKFIEEKQKNLPANFRKLLYVQLKKLVASEKLTKVKSSFKIGVAAPAAKKKRPATVGKPKATDTKKKALAAKTKVVEVKEKVKPVARKAKPAVEVKAPVAIEEVYTAPRISAPVNLKAAARPKAKERVAKAAKISTRTTPKRKVPSARAPLAKPVVAAKKKAPVNKAATRSGKK